MKPTDDFLVADQVGDPLREALESNFLVRGTETIEDCEDLVTRELRSKIRTSLRSAELKQRRLL